MRVISLSVENFKRISVVQIDPHGNIIEVTGKNGAGKSSVLDALSAVFGGASETPAEPVRRGAAKSRIIADLGDIQVQKTFTPDGKSALRVTNKDGASFPSPQALLDKLYGKLTLDPLAFSRMNPRQQLECVKGLVNLDFSDMDAERAERFAARTELGRSLKAAQAQAAAAPVHPGAPAEEVSIADLQAEWQRRQEQNVRRERHNDVAASLRQEIERAKAACVNAEEMATNSAAALDDTLKDIEKQLNEDIAAAKRLAAERAARAKSESARIIAGANDRRASWMEALEYWQAKLADLSANPIEPADVLAVAHQLAQADATNRKVRENRRRDELEARAAELASKVEQCTARIEAIDAYKRESLEGAAFPVPDLSFDESGVTLKGLPFAQASSAEQLRASVAIGLAANPKLRVLLIRDGSLLDSAGMELLAQIAESQQAQIWLERVSDGQQVGVVIEDGHVASPEKGTLLDVTG